METFALAEARNSSLERVSKRLRHRVPWLLVGLIGAMGSAGIVASFESTLREQVLLAFFVPAVVYIADAVGTQTETLVIRGMAAGVPVRTMAARELVTGILIGGLIAMVFFVFVVSVWSDAAVAAVVALSLLVSSSLATVLAMALPALLVRLGRDPAFGSGPLATVIQDLLSIVVYFGFAAAFLA